MHDEEVVLNIPCEVTQVEKGRERMDGDEEKGQKGREKRLSGREKGQSASEKV